MKTAQMLLCLFMIIDHTSWKDQNFDKALFTYLCVVYETQGSLGRVAMFGPSYFPEGVKKIIKQEKIEEGDEVHDDDGVKEGFQEDNGSKTHRMLSVLLTDLAHWRFLLTVARLLLTDYCCSAAADYFHLRQSPPFQLSYC